MTETEMVKKFKELCSKYGGILKEHNIGIVWWHTCTIPRKRITGRRNRRKFAEDLNEFVKTAFGNWDFYVDERFDKSLSIGLVDRDSRGNIEDELKLLIPKETPNVTIAFVDIPERFVRNMRISGRKGDREGCYIQVHEYYADAECFESDDLEISKISARIKPR